MEKYKTLLDVIPTKPPFSSKAVVKNVVLYSMINVHFLLEFFYELFKSFLFPVLFNWINLTLLYLLYELKI